MEPQRRYISGSQGNWFKERRPLSGNQQRKNVLTGQPANLSRPDVKIRTRFAVEMKCGVFSRLLEARHMAIGIHGLGMLTL